MPIKNDPGDMSFEEMLGYCVIISRAITRARKDSMEHGPVTAVNADMHQRLKRAQREIDILRAMIRQQPYTTVNGEIANGYTFASYKIREGEWETYYGHPNFGHTGCHEQAQAQAYLPIEECLVFLYDTPQDCVCQACGKQLIPQDLRIVLGTNTKQEKDV